MVNKVRVVLWFVVISSAYKVGFEDGASYEDPNSCDPTIPQMIIYASLSAMLRAYDALK